MGGGAEWAELVMADSEPGRSQVDWEWDHMPLAGWKHHLGWFAQSVNCAN